MVRRQTFVNKLRELGYTYKTQQKRTDLWRKVGGTHFVSVPRADLLEDEFVRNVLRQAGVSEHDALSFLASAKVPDQ